MVYSHLLGRTGPAAAAADPSRGGEDASWRLVAACARDGCIQLILDIVPGQGQGGAPQPWPAPGLPEGGGDDDDDGGDDGNGGPLQHQQQQQVLQVHRIGGDGEPGPEVYSGALSEGVAWEEERMSGGARPGALQQGLALQQQLATALRPAELVQLLGLQGAKHVVSAATLSRRGGGGAGAGRGCAGAGVKLGDVGASCAVCP